MKDWFYCAAVAMHFKQKIKDLDDTIQNTNRCYKSDIDKTYIVKS